MSASESSNWKKAAVLKKVEHGGAKEAGLQAFLASEVPANEIESVAHSIVAKAGGAPKAHIGPISRLARSFAVRADVAILHRIAEDPRVKSVLPASVDDILPKPRS